jgi:hypothetical protein
VGRRDGDVSGQACADCTAGTRWEAAGFDDLLDEGETRTGFLLRFTNAYPGMNTNFVGHHEY